MLAASKENLRKTSKWFERSEGDFVMGNGPCCAETVIVTFLIDIDALVYSCLQSLIAEVINCFKHEALPAPSLPNWIVSSLGVYQCHAGAIQGWTSFISKYTPA